MTTMRTDRDTGIAAAEKPDRQLPQGIFVGIGSVAVVVAAFVASALPQNDAVLRYGVLAGTVFVFTAVTGRWAAATWVAIIGYLVFDGFLVNQMGELSWNGRDDVARILTLSVAVIVGRLFGDCFRLYRLFSRAHVERRTPMASHHLLKEKEHHA
jgi:MFS family permease